MQEKRTYIADLCVLLSNKFEKYLVWFGFFSVKKSKEDFYLRIKRNKFKRKCDCITLPGTLISYTHVLKNARCLTK